MFRRWSTVIFRSLVRFWNSSRITKAKICKPKFRSLVTTLLFRLPRSCPVFILSWMNRGITRCLLHSKRKSIRPFFLSNSHSDLIQHHAVQHLELPKYFISLLRTLWRLHILLCTTSTKKLPPSSPTHSNTPSTFRVVALQNEMFRAILLFISHRTEQNKDQLSIVDK